MENHDYEIRYTFGHYPLQQYLVEFDRGRMQVTRQSWDTGRKMVSSVCGEKIPTATGSTDGSAQNWNTMCAACHTTNYKKYSLETDSYNATFSALAVSCESCHGPAKSHISYIGSEAYKKGERQPGSFLAMAKNSTQKAEIQSCFPCHARTGNISANVLATDEIMDNAIPEIPGDECYYADGQVKDEDYTYASFLQSKMYKHGVKCSNCHNPHSGKLVIAANGVCNQCHTAKITIAPNIPFMQ